MRRSRIGSYRHPLGIVSLVGRRASARLGLLVAFIREKGGALLPPAISGVAFYYFQSSASTEPASNIQLSARTDCLLVLVLATYFVCDTALGTALGLFTERLVAPLWHRVRERRPASSTNLPGRIRSLRQWLCSPSRIEKNLRPFRSVCISHNPPPHIPSLSTHCCI